MSGRKIRFSRSAPGPNPREGADKAAGVRNPVKSVTRSTLNVITDSTVIDHLPERSARRSALGTMTGASSPWCARPVLCRMGCPDLQSARHSTSAVNCSVPALAGPYISNTW